LTSTGPRPGIVLAEIFTAVDEAPALDVAADVELAGAAALLVAELLGELELLELEPPQPASANTTAGRAKPEKNALRTAYSLHFDHGGATGSRDPAWPGLRKRYRATLDP
jgi:hypothetical protein